MRFIINPETARVITATGQAFEAFNLTPERTDILLQAIDAAGGKATTGQLAQALGCNIPDASRLLGELSDRGSVRALMQMNRPMWERRTLDLNSALVREKHAPRILAFLMGRREMPGAIASALGLPRDEVAETCKFLMVTGQLVGTHIGAATVYALDIRGTTRIDLEAATQVPMSSDARFQAELAALPPVKLPRRVEPSTPARVAPVRKARAITPVVQKAKASKPVVQKASTPVKRKQPLRTARVKKAASHKVKVPTPRPVKKVAPKKTLKVTAPKLREARPPRVRKAPAAKLARPVEVFPEGSVRAIDAVRTLGIKSAAFYKWVNNNEVARSLCVKGRKYLMVPPEVITLYTEASVPKGATFAAQIPEGWLDIWQAVETLGWSYSKVYGMLAAGRLTACQAGGKLRFDPERLRLLKCELDDEEAVPEGWANLRLLATELDLHISSVVAWIRRRKYETRKYRDAERQLVLFAPESAATAYRAARQDRPGGLKLTPAMREALREELPPPPPGQRRPACEVQAVATRYGVTVSRVQQILKEGDSHTALGQAAD